ncbi:hypothetical protein FVE85_0689 [Porphyridium purpureum]|uniref:7-carboxy-7-deazaguanine synthase n=1 Tax=Porphyridium purpureum TaxID=35688 RepID=A0A5J4Z117_PORPP|nr:hypothetical protein FVE85_0689 [Porphyridium purpureum]|eukprot:POR5336..scf208_2
MIAHGVAYMVRGGSQLYFALTNRSTTVTLIASRGPKFAFGNTFQWLEPGYEPSGAELASALVDAQTSTAFQAWDRKNVVLAGGGEPLLCLKPLDDLLSSPVAAAYSFRLVTNGLFPRKLVRQHLAGRISSASVAVNGHDDLSYRMIMEPDEAVVRTCHELNMTYDRSPGTTQTDGVCALAVVQDFVRECRAVGISVDVTCVDRPNVVDLAAVEAFAVSVGAGFRTRQYFGE